MYAVRAGFFRGLILAQCSIVRQQFGRGYVQHLGNLFPLVFLRHLSGVRDSTIAAAIPKLTQKVKIAGIIQR